MQAEANISCPDILDALLILLTLMLRQMQIKLYQVVDVTRKRIEPLLENCKSFAISNQGIMLNQIESMVPVFCFVL